MPRLRKHRLVDIEWPEFGKSVAPQRYSADKLPDRIDKVRC